MITLESVILKPSIVWTKRVGNEDIQFTSFSNDRGLPLDVTIYAFSDTRVYNRFAPCIMRKNTGFDACIDIAIQPEFPAFLTAVGLSKVITVDIEKRNISDSLNLFREESDDRGFYRMQLHVLPDGFLINYESGIAKICESGRVKWHRKMVWNDVFVHEEESALFFRNEINPKGFYISKLDGSKRPT